MRKLICAFISILTVVAVASAVQEPSIEHLRLPNEHRLAAENLFLRLRQADLEIQLLEARRDKLQNVEIPQFLESLYQVHKLSKDEWLFNVDTMTFDRIQKK